jgi:Flp pilus assembly pilin Flp
MISPGKPRYLEDAWARRATAMRGLTVKAWRRLLNAITDQHDGQALVEYSLIFVLIIVVCITVMTTMGDTVRDELWGMTSRLPFW